MSLLGPSDAAKANATLRRQTRELVLALFAALKVARMYEADHPAARDSAQAVVTEARRLCSEASEVVLDLAGDSVAVLGVRQRGELGSAWALRFLATELGARGVGRLHLSAALGVADVRALAEALQRAPGGPEAVAELQQRLAARGCTAVTLEAAPAEQVGPAPTREPASSSGRMLSAVEAYLRTTAAVREANRVLQSRTRLALSPLKRSVQGLVEMVRRDGDCILAVSAVRGLAPAEATCPTHASILSLTLGERLGLTKPVLGDLGVTALLAESGAASPQQHLAQVRRWLEQDSASDTTVRALRASVERCRRALGQGPGSGPSALLADIVAVCEAYVVATAPAAGCAMLPPAALHGLLARAHELAEPAVAKQLVQTLGIYPPGWPVQLESGELGVVLQRNLERVDRPGVRVFADRAGKPLAHGPAVAGVVARVLGPEELGLATEEHLALLGA